MRFKNSTLMDGDLLITEGGDWDKVGRTCIWRSEISFCAHQNHVFKARKLLTKQSEIWLEKYLNSPIARIYFERCFKANYKPCIRSIKPNFEVVLFLFPHSPNNTASSPKSTS